MSVGILLNVIVPHAPILISALGGEPTPEAVPLVSAIGRLAQGIARLNPETIILATPHAPIAVAAFGLHVGDVLRGSFAHYGHPALGVRFENDLARVDEFVSEGFEQRMNIFEIPEGTPLVHGALVPLYFLWEAGWRGRVVVLGSSYLPDRDHVSYGRCGERAARALGRRGVFIGSANLSHRLSALAPSGYHPRAYEFDREIVSSLEDGDFARLSPHRARASRPRPRMWPSPDFDRCGGCRRGAGAPPRPLVHEPLRRRLCRRHSRRPQS